MVDQVSIDTTEQTKGPSLQESYDALVKEGTIQPETNTGDADQTAEADGQGDQGGADADERPSWLPKKFKTPEDFARSYSELEKKLSQGKQPPADEQAEGDEADAAAEEAVEAAGLDMAALSAEYDENGELSEDSYSALEKVGIPRSMVDAYVAGLAAQQALYENSIMEIAGGKDSYQDLITWGGSNLTPEEIDVFDGEVNSGDPKRARAAVLGLQARMQVAEGTPPERNLSGRGASTDVYQSQAQVEADMSDPRYATDEAFRQKVYAKMARSNI